MALLAACSEKAGSEDPVGSAGSGGDTGGSGGGTEAPLDNGPGGSLLMAAACGPDDGQAFSLVMGLGSGCDQSEADPARPYVRLDMYHPDLLADPVGTEVTWADASGGFATFAPEGRSGPTYTTGAGALLLTEWEGVDAGRPEGGRVAGWYVLRLDDGSEVGAPFSGSWCGGEPLCG